MNSQIIAVAVDAENKIAEHAGRAVNWQVYLCDVREQAPILLWTLQLTDAGSLHEWHVADEGTRHPLHHVDIAIAGSAGEGVQRRLQERKTQLISTAEREPLKAVMDFISGHLIMVPRDDAHQCNCRHHA